MMPQHDAKYASNGQLSTLVGFEAATLLRRSPATWLSASKPCSCKFRKLAFSKVLQVNMTPGIFSFWKLWKVKTAETAPNGMQKKCGKQSRTTNISDHQCIKTWVELVLEAPKLTAAASAYTTSIRHKAINQTTSEQQYNSPTRQRQCRWSSGLPRNKKQGLHAAASTPLSLHQDLESNTYNAGCGCAGFWQLKFDTTHLRDCSTTYQYSCRFLNTYLGKLACSRLTGQQQCRGHCASWAEFLKPQHFMPTAGRSIL